MSASNAARVGVWGRSGSGKSAYIKKLIKGKRRVVVFDVMDEYAPLGFKVIRGDLDAVRVAMRDNWQGFKIAYVPPANVETRALSALSRLLLRAQEPYRQTGKGSGLTLVVEEMNKCFSIATGQAQGAKASGFAEICSRGRHYGITVYGASQLVSEVSMRFRGNCDETVSFAQKGPRPTAAAAAEIGCDVSRIQELTKLHYLHEVDGSIKPGKLTFPAAKKK